jgi:hypothetical protein
MTAVAIRSRIDNRVATRARPSHRAASSQVSVVGIAGVGIDHAKIRRDMGIEEADVLLLQVPPTLFDIMLIAG